MWTTRGQAPTDDATVPTASAATARLSMDNDVVTQSQPHLPTPLHTSALPLAPPLPTFLANRTTSSTDDPNGSDHVIRDVEPRDDISTFLLHVRRIADDTASSAQNMNVRPADGAESVVTSAIGTGDIDTEGGASAPPTDITTDNTNNPVGFDGATPMGPNDDTLVVNSDTTASPTLKNKRKKTALGGTAGHVAY